MARGAATGLTLKWDVYNFSRRVEGNENRIARNLEDELWFAAGAMNLEIVTTTPVDEGDLQASWSPPSRMGPLHYLVAESNAVQVYAIEYGSIPGNHPWPSPGPRTQIGGGRIGEGFTDAAPNVYSTQAPLGVVRRALAKQAPQFRKLVLEAVSKGWNVKR